MSEPVSNSEIEDVLSSIRRLVSEDTRKPGSDGHERDAGDRPERLVLTPALRVADPADADPDPAENAEDGAALAGPDTAAEAGPRAGIGRDIRAMMRADASFEDAAEAAPAEAEPTDDGQSEAVPDADPAPAETPAQPRSGLEAKIAELEALIGRSDEEWEPESAGQGENAGAPTEALEWEDADLAGPDTDMSGAPDETATEGAAPDEAPAEWDVPGEEDQPEAASLEEWRVEAADPAPEPTAEDRIAEADATEETAEDTGKDTGDNTEDNTEAPPEDGDLAEFFDDSTEIDEAMLRDMLTEIVREELQGALGERITRNVRKLVRREIHRALTAREFD